MATWKIEIVEGGSSSWGFRCPRRSLRNSIEEIGPRGCELVATDEPTVVVKLFLDLAVVEDGEGNQRFSDPASTDESNRV